MFVIVSYDIVDDKRRSKIAKNLENYGTRVQYSVFETIVDEEKFEEMQRILCSIINQEEDSIRIYILCEGCNKKVKIYGTGEVTKDDEVYIV